MNERVSYILASLDMHLSGGMEPLAAIVATVEDYRDVYLVSDDRPVIARAANVALKRMGEWDMAVDNAPPTPDYNALLEADNSPDTQVECMGTCGWGTRTRNGELSRVACP